uniref:Uncharacterized protein n=1 Tax=Hanusia phi TaxID=3032 RepID=A0A7S0NBF5_9CRYP|mmetsp:Transcript_5003/g.11831  ORF Transcript_5003/g.11831 Transcript_5003/m.11831 type:complete len:126 (+) Transcript_5003:152-529(+)
MHFSNQFLKVGLPFFSFMVLGSFGLQQGLKSKYLDYDRRTKGSNVEDPNAILEELNRTQLEKEFEMKAVPGKVQATHESSDLLYLKKELQSLRESEKWTGIPLDKQKREVKQKIRALKRKAFLPF